MLRKIHAALFALAALVAVSGCATGPTFAGLEPVPPGQSQIYFLREGMLFGAGMSFDLLVDDKKVGVLANGGFIPVAVSPGRHELGAQTSLIVRTAERKTAINVAAGARSFVLVALRQRTEGQTIYWTYVIAKDRRGPGAAPAAESRPFVAAVTAAAYPAPAGGEGGQEQQDGSPA